MEKGREREVVLGRAMEEREGILKRKKARKEEGFKRAAWGQDGLIGRRLGRCMSCGFAWSGRLSESLLIVLLLLLLYTKLSIFERHVGEKAAACLFVVALKGNIYISQGL